MNLIVHPEGTAELDERTAAEVVADVLDGRRFLTINVRADSTMVTRVRFDPNTGDLSEVAARMMLHLTGQHYVMLGDVIFTELDPLMAVELLELARD